ncbi:MAG: acyltransferase family protein [Oscillospiraceae bacterium]
MKEISINNTRNIEMDLLKGVAILLVVFGHVISSESILFRYINTFHMPLFFFISGFFAYRSFNKYDISKIIYDKLRRLAVPFLCVSVLAVIMNILMDAVSKVKVNWLDYIFSSFIYAKSAWFLIVLFLTFFFHAVAMFLKKKNCLWLIVPLTILIYLFAPDHFLMLGKFKTMLPFFEIGYFINSGEKSRNIIFNKNYVITAMGVLYLILPAIYFNYKDFINYSYFNYILSNASYEIFQYLYYTFISACGIAFAFSAVTYIVKAMRLSCIMSDIGKYSLDIYIIHPFIIKIISLFSVLGLYKCGILPLAIQLACSVIITIMCWQLAKKILYKISLYRLLFAPENKKKKCDMEAKK